MDGGHRRCISAYLFTLCLYTTIGMVSIFVLPSLKEASVSLSMLEALAAGLPVVASDTPEVGENIGECSVLIQDPTAANYAKALDTLLSNREAIQHLSILSVQKARSYSWENVLSSIEDVYKQVTSSGIPPSGGRLAAGLISSRLGKP